MTLNIRSFNKNIDTFIICMDTLIVKPDILIFTKTWLTDKDNLSIYLKNYTVLQTVHLLKRKIIGGVVLICTTKYLD